MSRTPIPDHLLHKPEEVEKNAKLFDALVELIPESLDTAFLSKEDRAIVASQLFEKIRQKMERDGEFRLPFDLVVKRDLYTTARRASLRDLVWARLRRLLYFF